MDTQNIALFLLRHRLCWKCGMFNLHRPTPVRRNPFLPFTIQANIGNSTQGWLYNQLSAMHRKEICDILVYTRVPLNMTCISHIAKEYRAVVLIKARWGPRAWLTYCWPCTTQEPPHVPVPWCSAVWFSKVLLLLNKHNAWSSPELISANKTPSTGVVAAIPE